MTELAHLKAIEAELSTAPVGNCGCVLCDSGIVVDWIDAIPVHCIYEDGIHGGRKIRYVECHNLENMPSELQEEAELLGKFE